jgi:adenosylcobinamide-GDP ribazoletransferase
MTFGAARDAVTLLTVLPVGARGSPSPGTIAWFPTVGALLGALVLAADALVSVALPASVVAAIDLAVLALLTGGLHLDGLADAADGMLSGGDRERRLAIMREPAVGAFGISAIVLVLLVDLTALQAAPARAAALWSAAIASRWALAIAIWATPAARSDGLGAAIRRGVKMPHALTATVVAAALTLPLGLTGAASLVAAAAVTSLVRARALGVLGGATGDTDGATCEIAFAAALVMVLVVR